VADIVEARLVGITVSEILWELRAGSKGEVLWMPRATQRLPALYYRFPTMLDQPDELLLNPTGEMGGTQLVPFAPNKFIIAMDQNYGGHPSISAPLRCLSALWCSNVFGLEFVATNAQLFGIPFRRGKFQKGDVEGFNLLCNMLHSMGSAGWAAIPENTDLEFISAPSAGSEGPAERLVELSDKAVDIFDLGQTLSTDHGKSGSRALGQVHEGVKQEMISAVSDFVAETLKGQLVGPLIELNYGNRSEIPDLIPDVEAPKDELVMAQRDAILFNEMRVPISRSFLYPRHSLPQPEAGEALYVPPPPKPAPAIAQASEDQGVSDVELEELADAIMTTLKKPNLPTKQIEAFNPCHDEQGRFAEEDNKSSSGNARWVKPPGPAAGTPQPEAKGKYAPGVEKIAEMEGSKDSFWKIGQEVYRVSDETPDVNGYPQGKRCESSLSHFIHYSKAGVFGPLKNTKFTSEKLDL
jgi:phage gp29-like protein